jgi:Zn-dependent M28 family amino/carboxypeptidase
MPRPSTPSTPILAVTLLAATAAAQNPAATVEHLITRDAIEAGIRFLSDDLLEGRGVGTRGDLLARKYIATQMQFFGLEPGAPDGTWEQPVPILGITAEVTQTLQAKGTKGDATFQAPEDFTAFAARPEPETGWREAGLVFVGYGIHAPEQNWDDYKGADLKGKVLLVMNNDPADDPDLFAGKTRLYYGRWSYKYEEAARRGAVGAIVIHTTPSAGYPFHVIQSGQGREQFWLPFDPAEPTLQIRSWCSEDAAKKLCGLGGHDLDALRTRAETREFAPVELGVTVSLGTRNVVRELQSANVLGKITGTDPVLKQEAVVITAHFDHLGRGKPRGEDDIYNGAVDNASGTAAMLAIARACAALAQKPRRTLLFAAVTAEESGLLGSEWYCRNPTFPKRALAANFNLDSINVWGPTEDVELIGHGKNSLLEVVEAVARSRGRTVRPDSNADQGLFYRSDHFNFARIGVPSAYFKGGHDFRDRPEDRRRMKASYTAVHYHQPTDEIAQWWNLHGAVEDMKLVLECLLRVANADQAPVWTAGDEFEKLR